MELMAINNNESIKINITNNDSISDVIEVLNLLFPHTCYDIDVCGNDLIVTIKADTTIN